MFSESQSSNYSTTAISISSILRVIVIHLFDKERKSTEHWQNKTSHVKSFQSNILTIHIQGISGHQPENTSYIYQVYYEKRENAISSLLERAFSTR